MKIRDMMEANGRVFLKSEFAQIGDDWPCISFTKRSVGDRLRAEFQPGRDVLIYVGTTNPETTPNPNHRGRLISAAVIQPNQVLETRRIIPSDVWKQSVVRWGADRWSHAMAIIQAADVIEPFPRAHDVVPKAYSGLGKYANRGSVVEALGEERTAAMAIDVEEISLNLSPDVRQYLTMARAIAPEIDRRIKQEACRMAILIQERVTSGGEVTSRLNPLRYAPNLSELTTTLTHKWIEKRDTCKLCGGRLVAGTSNKMLQPSADRIDSENPHYNDENVQITHLACNWAKNKYSSDEFFEWLDVVRGENEGDAIDTDDVET
jgi:hypothetical protein